MYNGGSEVLVRLERTRLIGIKWTNRKRLKAAPNEIKAKCTACDTILTAIEKKHLDVMKKDYH